MDFKIRSNYCSNVISLNSGRIQAITFQQVLPAIEGITFLCFTCDYHQDKKLVLMSDPTLDLQCYLFFQSHNEVKYA